MTDCAQRLRVLHIAANYPDGIFKQDTTDAVRNLLEATSDRVDHLVVSIARILPPTPEFQAQSGNTISMSYYGLPGTIGHGVAMRRLATRIIAEIDRTSAVVDLVHGHKLTVEGLVAQHLAAKLGVPYVCTVRGFTDGRVLRWRPDKRATYRRLMTRAEAIFLPAPWTFRLLKKYLGEKTNEVDGRRFIVLPNIVNVSTSSDRRIAPEASRLVTVFREGHGKLKGFPELLKAVAVLKARQCPLHIDVLGCRVDGVEAGRVKSAGLQDQIRVLGAFPKAETLRRIATYQGLVLPTHSDTFGMVYTEALLSGVPVLYSADTGIDGLLDGLGVGVRVDPRDQEDVTNGLKHFSDSADDLRKNLNECLGAGRMDFLLRSTISATYAQALSRVAAGEQGVAPPMEHSAESLERVGKV